MRWPHNPDTPYLWYYLGFACAVAATLYWLSPLPGSQHWILALPVSGLVGLLGFAAGYMSAFTLIFLFGHRFPRAVSVVRSALVYVFAAATVIGVIDRSLAVAGFRDAPTDLLPYVGGISAWAGWSVGLLKVGKVA
jgi:hypothetical protein